MLKRNCLQDLPTWACSKSTNNKKQEKHCIFCTDSLSVKLKLASKMTRQLITSLISYWGVVCWNCSNRKWHLWPQNKFSLKSGTVNGLKGRCLTCGSIWVKKRYKKWEETLKWEVY
jgi:hypothetical protein